MTRDGHGLNGCMWGMVCEAEGAHLFSFRIIKNILACRPRGLPRGPHRASLTNGCELSELSRQEHAHTVCAGSCTVPAHSVRVFLSTQLAHLQAVRA